MVKSFLADHSRPAAHRSRDDILAARGLQIGFLSGCKTEFPDMRWLAGILEFLDRMAAVLGTFTLPVNFLLSGMMATAFCFSRVPWGACGQL